jgi:hypothetical protein
MDKISLVRSLMVGTASFAMTAIILVGSMQGSAVLG